MTICLHHNDLDGRCAAAIVHLCFPEARLFEMSYATPVPFEDIRKDETVIIVDFSLQNPGDWEKLRQITTDIIWCDHHETAIKQAPPWLQEINDGICDTERCGAVLAWARFMPEKHYHPYVVSLVDKWDRWVHNDDPEVLDFVAGSALHDTRPVSKFWPEVFDSVDLVEAIAREGFIIRRYETAQNADDLSRQGYEIDFEGHRCLVLNGSKAVSKIFASRWGEFPVYIAWSFNGKKYTVHLYSDKVRVNDIAVKHGGGGHPGAAGFVCDKLPWT